MIQSARRYSLRTELLVGLGFLASSAVIITGLATMVAYQAAVELGGSAAGRLGGWTVIGLLWLASTVVFVVFGLYLVRRTVLRPLDQLAAHAERLAAGEPPGELPAFESTEMTHLGERFQGMATQLLDTQSQVVRAEKLAGVGRLAAGVAHEIRNPLGAIANYVELLQRRGTEPVVVDSLRQEIGRIDRIVESLLDYSRPRPPAATVDVNSAVARAIGFLRDQGLFGADRLEVALEPALPGVTADPSALEQVVVNLLLNARDAHPDGRVWIGTAGRILEPSWMERQRFRSSSNGANGAGPSRRAAEPPSRPWRSDLAAGTRGVLLYVADEGPGVGAEARERVFDAFYTTKAPGSGTGLGLAIVQSTVEAARGLVWVDRAREGGAVFKIFLPEARAA